jgi:hypothetical protein
MVYEFTGFIQHLQELGIIDVLLPFILIFAIVFAVAQKIKLLGEKKNIHLVIALVVAMSVVVPHILGNYPGGYDVVDIMNQALPQVSLVAVAFLMVLILVGIVGMEWGGKTTAGILALAGAIAVFIIFGGAAGWWQSGWLYDWFGEDIVSLVIMLLVFGLIIWFITSEGKAGPMEGIKKIFETVGEWGKGGK